MTPIRSAALLLALAAQTAAAADGLRVVTWNITHYPGDRADRIATVVYGEWNGRSMDPDVFCLQEMTSRNAVYAFVNALNNAPGSPGDWLAAPVYANYNGSYDSAVVYRTSKLELAGTYIVAVGGPSPQHPRTIARYDMRPVGYPETASLISIFSNHFKAGTGDENETRRLDEAQILADHLRSLPAGRHYLMGADLNIRTASEEAYRAINGLPAQSGVLIDPISRVGSWHANTTYRNIHTQDPRASAGGIDDRYDQVLLSPSLLDKSGMDYHGAFPTPWNLATPEDPNHSYRAWGNDGTSFNDDLTVDGNTMVGPDIAQAIIDMADPDGHIPVFLDLDMPGRLSLLEESLNLGKIAYDETAQAGVRVRNAADAALWGANGIAPLHYTLELPAGVTGPTGPFQSLVQTQANLHALTIDASAYTEPGPVEAGVIVRSDDPARPEAVVTLRFTVVGCSPADLAAPLGTLDFFDVSSFLSRFTEHDPMADLAAPFGTWDFFDVSAFLAAYNAGCP